MGIERFESKGIAADGIELVAKIKEKAGELDNLLTEISQNSSGSTLKPECNRLTALAKTQLELSVMCAVKAVSRR